MKISLQDQANDPALWEVLKHKFEKPLTSNISYKEDEIHLHHDDHQEDDAPLEGEKRVKRHKTSKSSKSAGEETVIDEDGVIPEDETPELITELQEVDKRVPTIFEYERMRATLNDVLSNQFKKEEEYVYHLEQTTNFIENQIVWESRQEDIRCPVPRPPNGNTEEKKYILSLYKIHAERFLEADLEEKMNPRLSMKTHNYQFNIGKIQVVRITTDQPHGLDFMEQIIMMRENDKPESFSEADFKYLNKNDIEGQLSRNQVDEFINNIHQKSCIEAHEPYSIVDKPSTGLIYLNSKDEK
ncbi:hypothetical protein Tco_1404206 [Tanacetum coccineum]